MLKTELLPHQRRLIEKLKASGGVLAAHGVGSGKTLSSIAAADELGLPIEAIVPAPLIQNYHKELAKHLTEVPQDVRVRSYEKAVRDGEVNPDALAVMDEAHRARNANTAIAQDIAGQVAKAKARLLLTGTPVYNQPSDLAVLLNTAAGEKRLPTNPSEFKRKFVGEEVVPAPLLARLRGQLTGHRIDTTTLPKLINRNEIVDAAKGYVDVHPGGGGDFPSRKDESHYVEMSGPQHQMYQFHEGKMPWYLRAKIRAGLPMSKQESQELNAFQGALRQVSNTHRPYIESMTDEEEAKQTPKIQKMVEHLKEMQKTIPNYRGILYSNYLAGGLQPTSRALTKAGIPHHVFTGEVPKPQRDQMVRDYNEGKVPVMLLSGAGSEGLDLKGTKSIQIMEPHWNESRLDQVIGRGIRYKSHEHLPENERQVRVMKYYSTHPKTLANRLGLSAPDKAVEQYLYERSQNKKRIGNQIMDALTEASEAGPLKKQADYELSDDQLKARFERYKKLLREQGVYAGTHHKRIPIPKTKITEPDLKRLGFERVLLAIPEAGQDQFHSYRHPDNLFHLHSHPGVWTMHEDEHPSSTMLARKIGPVKAFFQGMPHVLTEGIPGLERYVAGQLTGRKSTADQINKELPQETKDLIEKSAAATLRFYGL